MWVLLRALWNLLRLPLWPLWLLARPLARPRGDLVLLEVRATLGELPAPLPPFSRFFPSLLRRLPTPVSAVRRLVGHVAKDGRVRGLVVVLPPLRAGWATCKALRDALVSLRASGKTVVCYLPQGGGNREMYIASAADRVFLAPEATLAALGLAASTQYLKGLLDKVGVEVEPFARSEYKTAAETLSRESMSDPQREQLAALLTAFDAELVGALAERPALDEGGARALFERAFLRGPTAVEAGFADGVCYEDELPARAAAEGEPPARFVPAARYLASREARFFSRVLPGRHVAVVSVRGAIGEVSRSSRRHVVAAIRAARADRRAVGVLLHVSSPGGSALASDLIHREVVRLAEKKPVVAYFGDVAASGGYYIAAPAHAIVAQPVTVTGSIGVVSARLMARDLLDRLGIRTETVRLAPHADFGDPSRELTDAEREILNRELDAFYEGFVRVVATGRGRPVEEVEPLARGRVWSGKDALDRGLVDRLGGFDDAVALVRERAGLAGVPEALVPAREVSPRRLDLPPPEPPTAPAAVLGALSPELADLLPLLRGEERVLLYAPGLPRIE